MATEKQYLFFKSLYDEENVRLAGLKEQAKTYLSLITFYSAFVLFVAEKLRPDILATKIAFFATVAAMLLAFLFSLLALQISTFEGVNDPEEIINSFGDKQQEDGDFFDDRIVDFAVACKRNSDVNDKKALYLTVAGFSMFLAIILQACYVILRIS